MSLSRPAKFPILKLPFLCVECVIKSWNIFEIMFFALTSKRARQIVKHLKIPLNRIEICLSGRTWIELGDTFRKWHFRNEREKTSIFDKHKNSRKYPLLLHKNAKPLYTSEMDYSLVSYTGRNEATSVKQAMELLNEVFKCSVETVVIYSDNFPESGDIGVKSTVNLSIDLNFHDAQDQKLSLLLGNLEVTGTCTFWLKNTENDFYVDPKLIQCQKLVFWLGSGAWTTREILLQFEVPEMEFEDCPFSVEDILSFVTHWFHSDNKKLEYLFILIHDNQIPLENFQTQELNPSPFDGRHRVPSSESFTRIDFSRGLEVVRHDGLSATIHVERRAFLFYIWHNQ